MALLLAVKVLPVAIVRPLSVVVAADSIAPPPFVLRVPPVTLVLNRLTTLPAPLAVILPLVLTTAVLPNARVPPLVASISPVLVMPPPPFIANASPATFASILPAVLLTTVSPPLPMVPLP